MSDLPPPQVAEGEESPRWVLTDKPLILSTGLGPITVSVCNWCGAMVPDDFKTDHEEFHSSLYVIEEITIDEQIEFFDDGLGNGDGTSAGTGEGSTEATGTEATGTEA